MSSRTPKKRFVATAASVFSLALLMTALLAGCASIQGQRGAYLQFIRPDQRPPLVGSGTAADSLFGPAGESDRGDRNKVINGDWPLIPAAGTGAVSA